MKTRAAGILMHISSLPSRFGVGDVGPGADAFADFLHKSGQAYWQILPIHPTDLARQSSPYLSDSAFAGNPLFISPELLAEDGLADQSDLDYTHASPPDRVDYQAAAEFKARYKGLVFIADEFGYMLDRGNIDISRFQSFAVSMRL